jgi:hypothetical protein
MFVKVNALLRCRLGGPERLVGRTACLLDADVVSDDRLSEGVVQPGGVVEFLFDLAAAGGFDSPLERRPDLYCVVWDDAGAVFYRSATLPNVDFLTPDPVTGEVRTTQELVFEEA